MSCAVKLGKNEWSMTILQWIHTSLLKTKFEQMHEISIYILWSDLTGYTDSGQTSACDIEDNKRLESHNLTYCYWSKCYGPWLFTVPEIKPSEYQGIVTEETLSSSRFFFMIQTPTFMFNQRLLRSSTDFLWQNQAVSK